MEEGKVMTAQGQVVPEYDERAHHIEMIEALKAEVERLRAEHERITGVGGLLHILQRDNVNLANDRDRLRAEVLRLQTEFSRHLAAEHDE